jgi:hypothetical protein
MLKVDQKRKLSGDNPQAMAYWIKNPCKFVEVMLLGLSAEEIIADKYDKRLEPESKKILMAVARHDYVAIPAGRGVAKTFTLAVLTIWWLYTRRNARVAVTGPKFDQLKLTIWAEIQKWLAGAPTMQDQLKWTAERILHLDPKMNSFGFILTSKEKENIAGVHGDHVLWIADEASNIDNVIFETIFGGMNDPEAKFVMSGNPTKASGVFFDAAFGRDKHKWFVLNFNSEKSARAMRNKLWWERMQRYPKDSDVYRVNVLGLPPRGNPKAIISLEECTRARDREDILPGNYLEMGLDPAAEGDDLCTIAIRQGMVLKEIRCFSKTQAQEVVNYTLNMLKEYRAKTGITSKVRIKVDDTGFGQAIRHMLALDEYNNIEVIPCLFGGKGNDEYKDYATIMWYELRGAINDMSLPNDDELIEELSTRESQYVGQNCLRVEPKREYKKRLGRSPDRADACILCFAKGPTKVFGKPEDDNTEVKSFDIDWDNRHLTDLAFGGVLMMESINVAALILNRDLTLNGLAAVYQFIQDKLWIYKEFYQENPIPDRIALVVNTFTNANKYEDDRDPRIIGNELMFRQEGDRRPLADVLRKENLSVAEAHHYDEFGAIALGARMFKDGKVIMHSELQRSRSEINLWSIKKGTTETEKNGFCKALLLILSEVRRQIKTKEFKPQSKYVSPFSGKPGDYRPTEMEPQKTEEGKNTWMAK